MLAASMTASHQDPRVDESGARFFESGDHTTGPGSVKRDFHPEALTIRQRHELLAAARAAVADELHEASLTLEPGRDQASIPVAGVFVTIRVAGRLRGCVGMMEPSVPLVDSVRRCAVMAATQDSRFEPLAASELVAARFEISLLSKSIPVVNPADVRIGIDGVIVSRGRRRGLLLPQVALEQGWNSAEFLSAACEKAELPPSAWNDSSVTLESFTAEVFGDEPEGARER